LQVNTQQQTLQKLCVRRGNGRKKALSPFLYSCMAAMLRHTLPAYASIRWASSTSLPKALEH
jgi:hypothetical protein